MIDLVTDKPPHNDRDKHDETRQGEAFAPAETGAASMKTVAINRSMASPRAYDQSDTLVRGNWMTRQMPRTSIMS